jgi:replicative DNA helicase
VTDISGIVLYNLLKNPEASLTVWPKLKPQFFNSDYSKIYSSILKFYNKYNALPSFSQLKLALREENTLHKINALELLKVPEDVDLLLASEFLADQYTQEETLNLLSKFVDKIPSYDSEEIKKNLAEILIDIEEKTNTAEEIVLMNDILFIDEQEILNKIPLGLNNSFDSNSGGMALTETFYLGGYRGSGKTMIACNIAVNQYLQNKVCVFFTIEMRAREIFNRFISMLSGVDSLKIRKMTCDEQDLEKIAKVRAGMFQDSEEVFEDYKKHRDYTKFEMNLFRSKKLRQDAQLIIIDNQRLTPTDVDTNLSKFKAQFGERLQTGVIDYLNAYAVDDLFKWDTQIWLSNKNKEMARKHNMLLVSPYQTDASGEARFSKGILDKADYAVNLEAGEDYVKAKSTKVRNIQHFEFTSPMDWSTGRLSADDYIIPSETSDESSEDIPWT